MYRMAAREAKNEFGRLLDTAQREPVTIEKKKKTCCCLAFYPRISTAKRNRKLLSGSTGSKSLS